MKQRFYIQVLAILILFLVKGIVNAQSFKQISNNLYELNVAQISGNEILNLITENSNFKISYAYQSPIEMNNLQTLNMTGSIEDILNKVLQPYDINYVIKYNQIILQKNAKNIVNNDNIEVSKTPEEAKDTEDVAIKNKQLDEIVVIGYGSIKKSDATGSLSVLKVDDKLRPNTTAPQELLQGKIAGVSVSTDGGQPGANATIRIRGGASINGNNDPLIVIDGVPVSQDGIQGLSNPLSTINPSDIESFTVLKDASATAIYGSRASNGVILVTTKRGSRKKISVTYDGNVSVGTVVKTLPVLSSSDFTNYIKTNYPADIQSRLGFNGTIYNTNWQKEVFQPAIGTDHNASIAGTYNTPKAGKITLPWRVSFGYTNQNGIVKTSNFERGTISIALSPSFLDNHLKIDINAKGLIVNNRFADAGGAIGSAIIFDPTKPVYVQGAGYPNGYFSWLSAPNAINTSGMPANPIALLEEVYNTSQVLRSIGNAMITYKVHGFEDLQATLNLGYDYSQGKTNYAYGDSTVVSFYNNLKNGKRFRSNSNNQINKTQLLDFYLNYNKDIKSIKSSVNAMVGYSWQHFRTNQPGATNYYLQADSRDSIYQNQANAWENYLVSFYGRINWNLMDRYLFTVSFRADGSSKFAPGNQFSYFPSAAFAWHISEEAFMKDSKFILSDLKLRLSWGQTGNQVSGNYDFLSTYYVGPMPPGNISYIINGKPYSFIQPNAYNQNLKWEKSTTYDVGVDFAFLNNRIYGSMDYYYKLTSDLLNNIVVPAGANYAVNITANVGNMYSHGVEFNIGATAFKNNNIEWDLGFNATFLQTRITKLSLANNPNSPGTLAGTNQILQVGYTPWTYYMYQQVYDKNGQPIENEYVDQNKDGVINASDLHYYHNPLPSWYLGFNTKLLFYNFDFGFSLRANLGQWMYNVVAANGNLGNTTISNALSNMLTATVYGSKFLTQRTQSDYFIQPSSFLRMDNIALGYTFNNIAKKGISIRVFAMVQNVFVITSYKGLDPEINGGIDNNIFPRPRTYTLGVNFIL